MCFIEIDDVCEVWKETPRRARKQHACTCCYRPILIGEKYVDHFDVFEGRPEKCKLCSECEKDRAEFGDAHNGTILHPGSMLEYLEQCVGDNYDDDGETADDETQKWERMIERIEASRKSNSRRPQ